MLKLKTAIIYKEYFIIYDRTVLAETKKLALKKPETLKGNPTNLV